MLVGADGLLTGPNAESTQIINGSVFGIHVSNINVTEQNDFSLTTSTSGATENDSIQVAVTPGSGTAIQLASYVGGKDTVGSDWNLAKSGATGSTINLTTSGALANVTKDLSTDQKFETIAWTFAAGSAS